MRPGCPVSSPDSRVDDVDTTTVLLDQPFASSEMGDSMDADLLPELSGETWVAATLLDEHRADLPPAGADLDLIVASRQDATLTTVREWVQSGGGPGVVRMFGVVSGATVLAVADRESVGGHGREIVASPGSSGKDLSAGCTGSGASGYDSPISRFTFCGPFGCTQTAYRLLDRGLLAGVASGRSHMPSINVQFVWPGSLLAHRGPQWDRSTWATDGIGWLLILLDMSVTNPKGNRHILVMVDSFSQWIGSLPAA